jgi:two-component system cell cycle sensor histidine kinase/response regulator CckA
MAKPQIMIVEDMSIVALSTQNKLRRLGYAVPVVVASAEEAIGKVEETPVDLVLMDIMLEGEMDGVEAAEQIRERFQIPVVFLTSHSDNDTLQRAKISEPFGYVLKPFEERELHSAIEIALYKHKMERKLQENEQWLATTLSSIGDAVIVTDANERIIFMNPVAESLAVRKLEDVWGNLFSDIFTIKDQETQDRIKNPATKAIQEGVIIESMNHVQLMTFDGRKIPVEMNAAPIKDAGGTISGVVLIIKDISERVHADEEKMQKEKLLAVLQTAGAVCHELASPMHAASGYVDLLLKEQLEDNPSKKRLLKVNNLMHRMCQILDKLRNITSYKTADYVNDLKIVDITNSVDQCH